jgi:divalent metal cation (Fe/Co/Zn/Cd) transporter
MKSCSVSEVSDTKLFQTARALAYFTICYNVLEGLVSIYFGLKDDSISLLGFGIDSFIEVASAAIVLIKLRSNSPETNLKHERTATFYIGVLFLILSLSVSLNSFYTIYNHGHPETTLPGLVVSIVSLSFMYLLYRRKFEVGFKLNSATIMADARCSLACIKLSGVLFIASILYWYRPTLWWVDSVSALIIALFIVKEGWGLIKNSREEDFKGGCGCH